MSRRPRVRLSHFHGRQPIVEPENEGKVNRKVWITASWKTVDVDKGKFIKNRANEEQRQAKKRCKKDN